MKKQNVVAIFLISIIFIIAITAINLEKDVRINDYLIQEQHSFKNQFKVIYDEKYNIAQLIYNDIISDNYVLNIISKVNNTNSKEERTKLRNKLYKYLYPKYKQWELLGIQQLHFHTSNNISFLRMHKPSKFGDDLTNIRESVRIVNTLNTPSTGFEIGKVKSGFRYVFPVLADNGHHIGSMEASISTNEFQKELGQSFHSKVNFLIKKTIIDKKVFKKSITNNYKIAPLNNNYYVSKNQHSNAMQIPKDMLKMINHKLQENKIFSIYFKYQGNYKSILFFPIKNIKDKKVVAYFTKYSNSSYLTNIFKDYYILLAIVSTLFILILIYIYKNNKYKEELANNLNMIHDQKNELQSTVDELEKQNLQIAQQMEDARQKDTMIAEQSRLASLGEMIGNIAHQWRQPLSAISTSASSMNVQNEMGILDCQNDLSPALNKIVEKTQFLSQTIEDFRNFIEGKKEKVEFVVSSAIDSAFSVVDSSILNHHITVIKSYDDMIFLNSYKNEFIQGILNIINNAKDALDDGIRAIDERFLFVNIEQRDDKAIITFQDNAGGIPDDIREKVFEPYFTTKHQSQGTGLGLYMTYKIIVTSMKGSLIVENNKFNHNGKEYYGAKFTIELPIILEEDKD